MSLPRNTVRVDSWSSLVNELHSLELVPERPEEGGHRRSRHVFRGKDVADWQLLTSIQRLPRNDHGRIDTIESSLVRNFRKYASAGAFDDKSEWYILAVAQHNGLPTRCLDWSFSPFVAAHFACCEESQKDQDGIIWCLDAGILREINSRNRAATLKGIAWVYDTRLLEKDFPTLEALDACGAGGPLMLLWEPPSLDQRIANQSALLSIMNGVQFSQDEFLKRHANEVPDLLKCIVIDKAAKSEIRDMLDQNNISERTLYPGLPGLCAWLRRYYGKAWA